MQLPSGTVRVITTRQAAEQANRGQVGPGGDQEGGEEGTAWQRMSDGSGTEVINQVQ